MIYNFQFRSVEPSPINTADAGAADTSAADTSTADTAFDVEVANIAAAQSVTQPAAQPVSSSQTEAVTTSATAPGPFDRPATGWDSRGRMYRHNVDAAMRVGTRFADRCWELHPQLTPSHNERVITALVLAAAAAVDDEDLAYVGIATDVSYLDVAFAVAGGKGDRISQTLMSRVAKRSKTWTQTLEGWMDVPFEHRALLSVAVQTVIGHAVEVRDSFASNLGALDKSL